MAHPQPVIGFFENVAEAQQAIQVLLNDGFQPNALALSTQTNQTQAIIPAHTDSTHAEGNPESTISGRFLESLFGPIDEARPNVAQVTVHVLSTAEAERATTLMQHVGAVDGI